MRINDTLVVLSFFIACVVAISLDRSVQCPHSSLDLRDDASSFYFHSSGSEDSDRVTYLPTNSTGWISITPNTKTVHLEYSNKASTATILVAVISTSDGNSFTHSIMTESFENMLSIPIPFDVSKVKIDWTRCTAITLQEAESKSTRTSESPNTPVVEAPIDPPSTSLKENTPLLVFLCLGVAIIAVAITIFIFIALKRMFGCDKKSHSIIAQDSVALV